MLICRHAGRHNAGNIMSTNGHGGHMSHDDMLLPSSPPLLPMLSYTTMLPYHQYVNILSTYCLPYSIACHSTTARIMSILS
jgi:hypothetical protein